MLQEFLTANRDDLIDRCRAKAAERPAPLPTGVELHYGIPLFLDQLIDTLAVEQSGFDSQDLSGASNPGPTNASSEISRAAAKHGSELMTQGLTVDQVVHDYGDLCQAVTELAIEKEAPIAASEFRTLNRCLDNAIAGAVTEFSRNHDSRILNEASDASTERLGVLAHEMRNLLDSAMLAVAVIKAGKVAVAGATGQVLDRSLLGLRTMIDGALAEVRLSAAITAPLERINVAEFIAQVQPSGALQADARESALTVGPVDEGLFIEADRQLLSSAVGNLLQNAFKFSKHHSHVSLRALAVADRVMIEVQDECGGLPTGQVEGLFEPFQQGGTNRTGLGLGLSISRRSVEAINGRLQVRNLPGTGCVFTINLPRTY